MPIFSKERDKGLLEELNNIENLEEEKDRHPNLVWLKNLLEKVLKDGR